MEAEAGTCAAAADGYSSWNGTHVVMADCNNTNFAFVHWKFANYKTISGFTTFNIVASDIQGGALCIDDPNGSSADWTPVQLYTCNTSTTMRWYEGRSDQGAVMLINLRTGKCLDVQSGSTVPGALAQIYHCAPYLSGTSTINKAQFWWFN
jgi:hypothetical protein